MLRIAIGGLQHETNTFSPVPATLEDFLVGGGWPGLLEGQAVIDVTAPMNLPIAGAIEAAAEIDVECVPVLWAAATPSGRVEQLAFDHVVDRFLSHLEAAGPFDGLYLDLHGAMATTSHDDGEGEFLDRVRIHVGSSLPIVASLDLHANVSERMFQLADALVGYRTYPHTDMSRTGAQAFKLLAKIVRSGRRPAKAMRRLDFLVTLPSQTTLAAPARDLYKHLARIEEEQELDALTWAGGFALADIHDCGQSVLAYASSQAVADRAADSLRNLISEQELAFGGRLWTDSDAVTSALGKLKEGRADGPILLADTQDNPGGGGTGDTTGLLHILVQQGACNAVVAMIRDPAVAMQAHGAGEGATIEVALGARDFTGDYGPWRGSAVVERVRHGRFGGTGPMWGGSPIDLGPCALLRIGGVQVIVCSNKMQAADQSILRHLDLDPLAIGILVLKSSVHFRADFQDVASEILIVESPGVVIANLLQLPYKHLRKAMRLPREQM